MVEGYEKMTSVSEKHSTIRYKEVSEAKANGATYTPRVLADFVAQQIVQAHQIAPSSQKIRVLDPAVGDGELLICLLNQLPKNSLKKVEVYGFETDDMAISVAKTRIEKIFPFIEINFECMDFLEFVLECSSYNETECLFASKFPKEYDLIIANPPYVRTQILGAANARSLTKQFGLSGRVDLYYAFILGVSRVLNPKGTAGIITSNRFMTTKSGACIRHSILERFNVLHVWDLGDTKIFEAAVLPAVLLVKGKDDGEREPPAFTSIYQTAEPAETEVADPICALKYDGVVEISDGRRFRVQHGILDTSGSSTGVWRVATQEADDWLATVEAHSWGTFRDIGRIRVGVKTCADKVFIRNDWQDLPEDTYPELLKPLTTHHVAHRFKPVRLEKPYRVLYTHEIVEGRRRAVDLSQYPRSKAYLEQHRSVLESRQYVLDAGREWYEIWVPQDPGAWSRPKLVFRDISEQPTFWIDLDGTVVNGDCYWLICDGTTDSELLWLAVAVGNSSFIEHFYDHRFHNKLYAGRRRFITQYVEKFPLPDPYSPIGEEIIAMAKEVYECKSDDSVNQLQRLLDKMVWEAFGLVFEKSGG